MCSGTQQRRESCIFDLRTHSCAACAVVAWRRSRRASATLARSAARTVCAAASARATPVQRATRRDSEVSKRLALAAATMSSARTEALP
jgi:hypothetical protein